MKKVVITGGLSCGKSTVCHILQALGSYVVSADKIVHDLLTPKSHIGQEIIAWLGSDIIQENQLDRHKIAQLVFQHSDKLRQLENLLHPAVKKEIHAHYVKVKATDWKLFVAEIPLFFETATLQDLAWYDYSVTVIADRRFCLKRFLETTSYDEKEFGRRLERQLDPLEKSRRASFTLVNNTTVSDLEKQTKQLFERLSQPCDPI